MWGSSLTQKRSALFGRLSRHLVMYLCDLHIFLRCFAIHCCETAAVLKYTALGDGITTRLLVGLVHLIFLLCLLLERLGFEFKMCRQCLMVLLSLGTLDLLLYILNRVSRFNAPSRLLVNNRQSTYRYADNCDQ